MSQMILNKTWQSTKSTLFFNTENNQCKKNVKSKNKTKQTVEMIIPVWKLNDVWGLLCYQSMLSKCWFHIMGSSGTQRQLTQQWCKIDFWQIIIIIIFFLWTKAKNVCSSQNKEEKNLTWQLHETKGDKACLYLRAREHRWNQSGSSYLSMRPRWRWCHGRKSGFNQEEETSCFTRLNGKWRWENTRQTEQSVRKLSSWIIYIIDQLTPFAFNISLSIKTQWP